jgi:hypothetical protein
MLNVTLFNLQTIIFIIVQVLLGKLNSSEYGSHQDPHSTAKLDLEGSEILIILDNTYRCP